MARLINPRTARKRIAVVGDGSTEKWYFQQLRTHESTLRGKLAIEPQLPKSSGFRNCMDAAADLCMRGFDEVHCLIDYDQVVRENATSLFEHKAEKLTRKFKDQVWIYRLHPCFEIWLLLHFQYTTRAFDRCARLESLLRNFISDYNKSQNFWQKNDVYALLRKALFTSAIKNAYELSMHKGSLSALAPRAEIYSLILQIIPPASEAEQLIKTQIENS